MADQIPPRRYAISEVTTMSCSFEEDAELYAGVGCDGIGMWGFKMGTLPEDKVRDTLNRHGLRAANCLPELNSIMPYVLSPEPADPRARVEAFLPNMERMARFAPESIVVITGPPGDRDAQEVRDLCMEGFERIGRAASDLGLTVSLEPIHRSVAEDFTTIWDVPGTLDMLEELGQPSFKMLFDTWHLWDTPDIEHHIARHIDRIGGVHFADWRANPRSWADRAFPGEGIMPLERLVSALETAGFRGMYDIEIFSDNGEFDTAYEDSLWALPAPEIVDRATRFFRTG